MLKKIITYTNPFTDEEVTEEHYFHISKADVVEMQLEEHNLTYKAKDGQDYTGMQAKLMKIMDSEDGKAILVELKDIIRRSYGRKVGDRFVKSPEVWAEFSSSEAFSQLLFELCTDAEKAGEFMNGVVPSNLAAEAQAIARQSADISDREEGATVTSLPSAAVSQGASAESSAIAAVEELADRMDVEFPKGPRLLSDTEIRGMDPNELRSGIAEGRYKLS